MVESNHKLKKGFAAVFSNEIKETFGLRPELQQQLICGNPSAIALLKSIFVKQHCECHKYNTAIQKNGPLCDIFKI